MMNLRTRLEFPSYDFRIDHSSQVLTLGSCFSEVIGQYLHERKFRVLSNPFGTVYNPVSLQNLVDLGLDMKDLDASKWVERQGVYFHMDVHSQFWGTSKEHFLEQWTQAKVLFQQAWGKMNLLVLTLGTSWVYTQEGEVVSNCHKVPSARFQKRLLSLDEEVEALRSLMEKVPPGCKVLISVSPVRHIKDGLAENGLSKALLRVCTDAVSAAYPNVFYFPSYEALVDDLRDYRFYADDLIHPSSLAEAYICEAFMERVVRTDARDLGVAWKKVHTSLSHRPLQEGTATHKAFLENLLQKIETFRPHFDVSTEWAEVQAKYSALGRTSQD